jgi:hypothetical protein
MDNYMCMCICKGVSQNPNSNTAELDWPQHDHPALNVIAQQYSSATFVSLRFHSRKTKFGALFKNMFFSIFNCLNYVSLKMHDVKLRKSGSFCNYHSMFCFLYFA